MKGWRHIKEVALYQGIGAISRMWRHMKGWRHIKEVALYQGGGAVWRGGAISRKWRYIKEVAPYEGVAPHQGIGAISRRWRYIQELASCPVEARSVWQTAVPLTSPPPRPARLIMSAVPHHSANSQYYQCGPEANRRTPSLWLKHKVSRSDTVIYDWPNGRV